MVIDHFVSHPLQRDDATSVVGDTPCLPRASFGTPQSLGCFELPLASAAKMWPYTPIGTPVTIEN